MVENGTAGGDLVNTKTSSARNQETLKERKQMALEAPMNQNQAASQAPTAILNL